MSVTGRTDDELRSLLGAYALDAVDDMERRAVERYVTQDAEAGAELRSLRATAAELAAAAADTPPPALRSAVLAEIARTPQLPAQPDRPGVVTGARRGATAPGGRPANPFTRMNRFSLAVAAAAVVAVAVPGMAAWQAGERAAEAEAQAQAITDVLTDASAELVRAEVAGGGDAVAVLSADGAVLLAAGLPELDADRVYQLWTIRDGAALPDVLLDVEDGGSRAVAREYQPGDGLAVTVEPAGGSEQPTTEPIVVLLQS